MRKRSHVAVFDDHYDRPLYAKLPPLRYWLGHRAFYPAKARGEGSNNAYQFCNKLNLLFVCVLPTMGILAGCLFLLLALTPLLGRRKTPEPSPHT